MAVTSMQKFKSYQDGCEVTLPGFVADEPICVKLKRVSMLAMAQAGRIPNALLTAAAELFKNGINLEKAQDGEDFKQIAETMTVIARESLVEPTYEELEEAGVGLTDTQLLYIYNFCQTGVDALKSFRKEQEGDADHRDGASVPKKAKRTNGH